MWLLETIAIILLLGMPLSGRIDSASQEAWSKERESQDRNDSGHWTALVLSRFRVDIVDWRQLELHILRDQ
jgi:hypothetical protein